MHTDTITVQSTANTVLKQVEVNQGFQLFATGVLAAAAIRFILRGNALEGFEIEISNNGLVDWAPLIAELIIEADKL